MRDREHQEQVAVVRWFDAQYPALRGRLFAIPNGGQRNLVVAAKLKAEGVRAGVPDLCLPVARHGFHGLWIELKAPKRGDAPAGRLQASQIEWLKFLGGEGHCAVMCIGADSAIETIRNYLKEPA